MSDSRDLLLKDAVRSLLRAGHEINSAVNNDALWSLYDSVFGILEYLGASGLPRKREAPVKG